jgi:hypothetical protein
MEFLFTHIAGSYVLETLFMCLPDHLTAESDPTDPFEKSMKALCEVALDSCVVLTAS